MNKRKRLFSEDEASAKVGTRVRLKLEPETGTDEQVIEGSVIRAERSPYAKKSQGGQMGVVIRWDRPLEYIILETNEGDVPIEYPSYTTQDDWFSAARYRRELSEIA